MQLFYTKLQNHKSRLKVNNAFNTNEEKREWRFLLKIPSKVKQRFNVWWQAGLWPCQKVELCDRARLICFQVFQVETSN